MEIIENISNGIYGVTLSGKFTFSDHQEFRSVLQKAEENNIRQVVLNMALVDFIDSAALGMLLLLHDIAKKNHKEVMINGATGHVKKIFEMAKFETMFAIS